MSTARDPAGAYLKTKVLTAPPEELRLLLLDGAIRFATQARDGLLNRNYESTYGGFSQCRAIVLELLTTIRPDADQALADRVRSVYTFIFGELVEASFSKDVARLDKVIQLLQYERETWAMLLKKLAEERAAAPAPAGPVTDSKRRGISLHA